ncbi:MAG: two-component sensor histidine kinase [Deltaproteobacteria bacterium RBG_13_58_19]|nr:MAG: two-component sensor histidine kinase [Deltaproteobacteria bacterium RBG_13_58_19]
MEKAYLKKLWWEIVITIVIFSIVPLLVLGAVGYRQFSASYTAKITENLKTLAENRQGALDLFLEERVAQLVTLAGTHSLDRLKNEDYLNKVFNIIESRSRSYMDLGVIDQEGHHLSYVGPYYSILKGVNYKNEDWFNAVMASGIYVSDVFLGFRKVPHFIIAVMVREGNRNWVLRATIDSDILENIVRAAQIGKRGDAFIINGNNILQTTPRFSGPLLEHPTTPDFAATVAPLVEEITFDGEESLFGAIPLKIKKWVLVIKEDPTEQLTPLLRARYLAGGIGLAGILLIILGAVFATRSLMNELQAMERKKAVSDDMVVQSSKMAALGKMAAGIAHGINNPLAVIGEKAGWIKDLLRKEDVAQSKNFQEFADAVNKIEFHINRAKKITHRLLSFGRRLEPVTEKVHINRVLDETIDFLENEARYRNIDIQTDLAADLPTITSDSSQLQQVFLNIINNGIDAIGKNGRITIKTKYIAKNDRLSIEINDTGPGIPKELLDKIFDPFFTTKEVGKGTGLGLSISYSIVEKLGGRMLVASEEGQGSTFAIYLPAG